MNGKRHGAVRHFRGGQLQSRPGPENSVTFFVACVEAALCLGNVMISFADLTELVCEYTQTYIPIFDAYGSCRGWHVTRCLARDEVVAS